MPMSDYVRGLRALIGHTVLEVPTVSLAALDVQGRLLLVRHAEGDDWTTPGGMVEPYETPADAAVREMYEETGLVVVLTHIVGVFGGRRQSAIYANGDRIAWVATLFGCQVVGGSPRPDGTETLECRYVTREEAAALRLKPHMPPVLDAVWSPGGQARFDPPTWRAPEAPPGTAALPD